MECGFTRREALGLIAASGLAATRIHAQTPASAQQRPLSGALMILHTPFTAKGDVDWDDLAREALFVDRAGAAGVVWAQGSSSVATLTKDERLRGMKLLTALIAAGYTQLKEDK